MTDCVLSRLTAIERPRVLMRAARFAVDGYSRDRALKDVLGCVPPPDEALARLIRHEADVDRARQTKRAGYSDVRHVTVLSAVLGEARLVARLAPRARIQARAA